MEIKPFGKNILVSPIAKKQVLVNENKSLCEYGLVSAVGSNVKNVSVGDKIGFTIWGLNKLAVEGTDYYFVPEDDRFILGVIKE